MNQRHREKRLAALRYVLALPKSIWYNFRLLPFCQACHLPLLLSHRTRVVCCSGRMVLHADRLRIGLVKIGFNTYQQTHFRHDITTLSLQGTMEVMGECAVGAGCSIQIGEKGVLTLGDKSLIGPKTLIICHRAITFGRQNRVSWCCTFMDSDQHRLIDENGNCCNEDRPILFDDYIWMGCHVIVSKGTRLPSYTPVGTGSVLHGTHTESRTVLAGNPAHVVRRNVVREDFLKEELRSKN